MTSALLIEDRLTETERKMEEDAAHGGVYLVIVEKNIEERRVEHPPRIEDIRKAIGRSMLENAPFRAMPGVVYWVYEEHRLLAGEITVQVVYEEHDHLFIQDELKGIVVVTRLDATGRICLLSKEEAKTVQQWVRVVGFAS